MIQIPLFQPPSEWTPPEKFPDLSEAKEIAIDLETCDPSIKELGPGWARGEGYVLGVAIAVDEGLLVPVIKDTDKHNILDISTKIKELCIYLYSMTFYFETVHVVGMG